MRYNRLTRMWCLLACQIANPLNVDMHIEFAQADAGVGGETYAHFDQPFTSFVIPAKGTANSGKFGNVVLTKGALLSLPIIPSGHLDVFAAATVTCVFDSLTKRMAELIPAHTGFHRIGDGGYTIPWLPLTQLNVPTKYDLAGLSLSDIHQARTNPTTKPPPAAGISNPQLAARTVGDIASGGL